MRKPKLLLLVGALFVLFLIVVKIVYEADRQPYFIDETSDSLAAYHFIQTGDYFSYFFKRAQRFGPTLSVGIASSWPAGLVWSAGGDLFQSRLALGFVGFLQGFFLLFLFLRSRCGRERAVFFAGLVFLLSLQIPYWHGFLLNVGELTGALFLGFGLLLLKDRPRLSFFLWGIGVWSCKFIYSPLVFAWGVAYLWTEKRGLQDRLRSGLELSLWFFLPLLLWLGVMTVRYDLESTGVWIGRFLSFIIHGGSGLDEVPKGLFERLRAPALEWQGYGMGAKLRILGLFFGPVGLAVLLVFLKRLRLKDLFLWASVGALLFYAAWYFLWSPMMLLRHAQPGLYLGFGLLVWMIVREAGRISKANLKRCGWGLVGLILLKESMTMTTRFPLLLPLDQSYPRNCVGDLTRVPCVPEDIAAMIEEVRIERGELEKERDSR